MFVACDGARVARGDDSHYFVTFTPARGAVSYVGIRCPGSRLANRAYAALNRLRNPGATGLGLPRCAVWRFEAPGS